MLARAIALVAALLAAFGGRVALLEPPERFPDNPKDGISSVIAILSMLIILLIISALSRGKSRSHIWIWVASVSFVIFLATGGYYIYAVPRHSFPYELAEGSGRFVFGDDYAPIGKALHIKYPTDDAARLVDRAGGIRNITKVWTPESLDAARLKLTGYYIVILLFLATSVFAVVQGVFGEATKPPPTVNAHEQNVRPKGKRE